MITPSPSPPLIFLIGYRGSGKSCVARIVAERLGWDWVDADTVLEANAGKSIRRIFAEEGEPGFRDRETATLREVCQRQRHVIATGGGVVLREDNRKLLREGGLIVWLIGNAATLWQRIQADATTAERRPNLAAGGLAEVEELLRVREPLYRECAHLSVDTEGRSPEQVADAILIQITEE